MKLGGPRACSSDVPHFLVCREEQWRSLGAIPRDLEPPCPELLPMPSCADEDVTCEVPHDGRNRRPPSLLAEALSSACPVPIPHVLCREEVQLLVLTLPPLSHDVPAFHAQPQALPRQVPGKVTSLYSCMTSNPKSHLHLIYPLALAALCVEYTHTSGSDASRI